MARKRLVALLPLLSASMCVVGTLMVLAAVLDAWLGFMQPMLSSDTTLALDDPPLESPVFTQVSATPLEPMATLNPTVAGRAVAPIPPKNTTAVPGTPPTPTALTPAATLALAPVNGVNPMFVPLIQEAKRRRSEREGREPQAYAQRVDKPLNQNRINFLVFGYGTTYEPPLPPQYKGSIAIYSLDLRTLQINTVTLNHDIRAPEVERYIRSTGREPQPTKIHFAYPTGGFDLMRLVTEDATGFSVDFQLAFQDSCVKNIVDDVLDGLSVDVPFSFEAEAIYFQNVKYPPKLYARGRQRMSGLEALQFIKAVRGQGVPYDAGKELAIRKQIVVQALLDAVKKEATNPLFWGKLLAFLNGTLERKEIEYDFDAPTLLFKSIGSYIAQAARGQAPRVSLARSLYIVDAGLGDGGVEWVMGSANPLMVSDLKNGVYDADKYLSVPLGKANPYAADLVANYWPSVRQLIRQKLIR